MRNLVNIIRMYFQSVSSYNILRGNINYKEFKKTDFDALALRELTCFSETESDELYNYLSNSVGNVGRENALNVFRALKVAVKQYLLVRDNQPMCDYDRILEWRELSRCVGEDFGICAFLAERTERDGYIWNDFEWATTIGHDNVQLNCIMRKGISDNHFHLFGSAPIFNLIWIKLMNQIENSKYVDGLRKIDNKKRQTRNKYSREYQEEPLEKMHFQAALIRVILFYYVSMAKHERWDEANEVVEQRNKIQRLLVGEDAYKFSRGKLQCFIDSFGMLNALVQSDATGDYANLGYYQRSINHDFEGERALMYQMLLGKIDDVQIPAFLMNWFYAYMVIQIKFREELIQVNNTIGFENFSRYSERKSLFLFTPHDDKKMVQHAVRGSFEAGNIEKLEVRITPGNTAGRNAGWIKKCDAYMEECLDKETLQHIYYVLHFPKEKDEEVVHKHGILQECRHGKFRRMLERQAAELIKFREIYPEEASRVLGIDACAKEIGCRPEVFAPIFRLLGDHVACNPIFPEVKQWKKTYHVGEDWLDAVDGLRAIDEAILFLEMKRGDRLGHATILGIDIKRWYKKKRKSVRLPLQDYLDNVVWLYHKLIDFNIINSETLKGHLLREYDRCFKKIYARNASNNTGQFSIDVYYEAWKLRGDSPEMLKGPGAYHELYQYLYPHWINESIENGKEIRKSSVAVELFYNYHYLARIRCAGNVREEINIPDFYIEGVVKVQKAMKRFVADRGIFVETNPSSNLLISTMDKYADHPITNLYNLGLTWNSEGLRECPQLHVSINTDDKGVFHTSLENEYALMSCALEQMLDENGENKYQKQMVHQWLDRIRENGNQQSFLQLEEKKYGIVRKNYPI